SMSVRAMKAGALDFLMKPFDEQDLLDAIQRALERSRLEKTEREELHAIQERALSLSPREREVFSLVVSGLLNKQIADRLNTSEKTIKVHRAAIMAKMNALTFADLVRMAAKTDVHSLPLN
ncbi:MAG: LuxR C-terminal-related transcriptional regulator, partial [Betaproteobacteria bacterium]